MKNIRLLFVSLIFCFSAQGVYADSRYADWKKYLSEKYALDFGADVSVLAQRSSPNGKNNAVQLYVYPYFAWEISNNKNGTGTLNFAYSLVRYGNHTGSDLIQNSGFLSGLNDYPNTLDNFAELYYEYQFGGKFNRFSIGIGQFPIYNFDGTEYNSNQQVNFLNDALSQNASATYTQAGIGLYAKVDFSEELSLVLGGQDGTNIDAESIRFNHLADGHYTTFGYVEYKPFKNGEISLLVYNQPYVKEQKETTNGWSLNFAQDIDENFSVFARLNESSGDVAIIRQSWMIGGVFNNPLKRNKLDQIGIAYAYNKGDEKALNETVYHKAEQVFEVYWSWGIGHGIIVTPDVQFYINPLLNQKSDYGVATGLRATLFF